MDSTTQLIYIHELRNQCGHIQASLSVLNQALEQRSAQAILFGAQSVLLAASQIASILWPTRARSRRRGEALRKLLQLPDKHPLNDRRLSEVWEQSDQKLEDWIGRTKGQRVLFDQVGPLEMINLPDLAEENIFRLYDTKTKIFYFRGVGYNIQAIANALNEVANKVAVLHDRYMREAQAAQQPAAAQQASNDSGTGTTMSADQDAAPIETDGKGSEADVVETEGAGASVDDSGKKS